MLATLFGKFGLADVGISSAAFIAALGLTATLVAVAIRVCRSRGWVANPCANRWHRGTPTSFGGVPMWLGFIVASAIFLPFSNHLAWGLVGISSLMFALGFVDDIFRLRPRPKLLAQLFAAVLVLSCGIVYPLSGNLAIDIIVSIVWMVGITNAFNLLDNMDGLSAGVALIAAFYLVIFYISSGSHDYAVLVCVAAGAIAGFLLFNFHQARIFMGNGGSLFIGFLLATSGLLEVTHVSGVPSLVFAPIAVLAVPIFDTFFVSVTRPLRGQPVSVGGTDHSSHRLVRLGLNERNAVLLLYALTVASGAVALAARQVRSTSAIGLMAFWFLFLFLFGIHLFRSEPHADPAKWPLLGRLLEHDMLAFVLDPVVLFLSYYLAYFLRFRGYAPSADLALFLHSWPIVVGAKFSCLWLWKIYRHSWWRGSVTDAYALAGASITGEALAVLLLVGLYHFAGYSRAVFALDCLFSWAMLYGVRKSSALFREFVHACGSPAPSMHRVFVLGTSERAELALRFLRNRHIECAGLIDTNGGCDLGRYIWGALVVGSVDELVQLASRHGVSEVILPEDEPIPCSEAELSDSCRHDHLQLMRLGLYSANGSIEAAP